MPEYRGELTEAERQAVFAGDDGAGEAAADLGFYIHELQALQQEGSVEGMWDLLEGEVARTEKRRFTLAAKQLGLLTTWKSAPAGVIRVVLTSANTPSSRDG